MHKDIYKTIIIGVLACMSALVSSCATLTDYDRREWTKGEKALLIGGYITSGADAYTTSRGMDYYPYIKEANPILREHPSDAELAAYFIAGNALWTYLVDRWIQDPKWRKFLLGLKMGVNGGLAVHNYNLYKDRGK